MYPSFLISMLNTLSSLLNGNNWIKDLILRIFDRIVDQVVQHLFRPPPGSTNACSENRGSSSLNWIFFSSAAN